MSAANLQVTTLGDELELATGGQSKTVSISLKDRAAILLGGHRADTALWFDETTSQWVTSDYYARDGKLPEWVTAFNAKGLAVASREGSWKPSVSAEALKRVTLTAGAKLDFDHPFNKKDFGSWATSPKGNEFLFQSAKEAVRAEQLGQDDIPDLLTLNLASNDHVGHRYGPDSPEVLDISVQTDQQLASFFAFLERTVPGGLKNVTVAISADHGVCGVPEVLSSNRIPAGRAIAVSIRNAAEKALDDAFGAEDWIASTSNGEFYFHPGTLEKRKEVSRRALEEKACEAVRPLPHVYAAYGRGDVISGRLPNTPLASRITRNFNPSRSGDVFIVLDPLWLAGSAPVGSGTTHGSPWTYDTHVPCVMGGFGVRTGVYGAPVAPAMIAPTLAHLMGIARPSGAEENLLPGLAGVD